MGRRKMGSSSSSSSSSSYSAAAAATAGLTLFVASVVLGRVLSALYERRRRRGAGRGRGRGTQTAAGGGGGWPPGWVLLLGGKARVEWRRWKRRNRRRVEAAWHFLTGRPLLRLPEEDVRGAAGKAEDAAGEEGEREEEAAERDKRLRMLQEAMDDEDICIGAIFGMDVGGSLTKLVYFDQRPEEQDQDRARAQRPQAGDGQTACAPDCTEAHQHQHDDMHIPSSPALPFNLQKPGMRRSRSLQQLTTPDHQEALDMFYSFMDASTTFGTTGVRDDDLSFYARALGGRMHFVRFETRQMQNAIRLIKSSSFHHNIKTLGCTGGGAYKYAKDFLDKLQIDMHKMDEMTSLLRGLHFVLGNVPGSVFTYRPDLAGLEAQQQQQQQQQDQHGSRDSLEEGDGRERSENGQQQPRKVSPRVTRDQWTLQVSINADGFLNSFPYLVVSIGSGVSILRVDGIGKYERISGSSIGGGTYLGLCRLLTGAQSFDEILELSEQGVSSNVDMTVGDIYGSAGYGKFRLAKDTVASSFGKLVMADSPWEAETPDLARSLLYMVTNNIGQVAYLNARLANTPRIFFVGNFIRNNRLSCQHLSYAISFWSGGNMEAFFLEHEGYLGAIGAFLKSAFGDSCDQVLESISLRKQRPDTADSSDAATAAAGAVAGTAGGESTSTSASEGDSAAASTEATNIEPSFAKKKNRSSDSLTGARPAVSQSPTASSASTGDLARVDGISEGERDFVHGTANDDEEDGDDKMLPRQSDVDKTEAELTAAAVLRRGTASVSTTAASQAARDIFARYGALSSEESVDAGPRRRTQSAVDDAFTRKHFASLPLGGLPFASLPLGGLPSSRAGSVRQRRFSGSTGATGASGANDASGGEASAATPTSLRSFAFDRDRVRSPRTHSLSMNPEGCEVLRYEQRRRAMSVDVKADGGPSSPGGFPLSALAPAEVTDGTVFAPPVQASGSLRPASGRLPSSPEEDSGGWDVGLAEDDDNNGKGATGASAADGSPRQLPGKNSLQRGRSQSLS